MPDALHPIHYATPTEDHPGQGTAHASLPFEATLARLKEAIAAEDLWIIHEINPQALLARGGYAMGPARQILFFHPRYVARLLAVDPGALVEAPLKIAILELPDGRVILRHPDPEAAFARYPGLEALGGELGAVVQRILATVTG